jgi:hypothetical protein
MAHMGNKDAGGTLMSDPFAEEEEYLPTIFLGREQLAALGDIGSPGDTREIHCKVRVATVTKSRGDASATLEILEMEFMEGGEDEAAERMYPTMKE